MSADQREADQIPGLPLPEEQAGVTGHDSVFATLGSAIGARRLPGAILLHGPRGIGKATLAFAFARELLSATGDESPSRVQEQIASGGHPNVQTLRRRPRDAKGFYSVIRIDDVRALRQRMTQTRGRVGFRVCIVDSIDDCNASAANGLLKILEEPPSETVFVLVSHRPGHLLPTIRSRCHAHALRPLPDSGVQAVLRQLFPDRDAAEIARSVSLAAGRVRRAAEILALGDLALLTGLTAWLADPAAASAAEHLAFADAIAAATEPEQALVRDLIADHLAREAGELAAGSGETRFQLASTIELWEKSHAMLAAADTYNLDVRQTFVAIFDAIRQHARALSPAQAVTR